MSMIRPYEIERSAITESFGRGVPLVVGEMVCPQSQLYLEEPQNEPSKLTWAIRGELRLPFINSAQLIEHSGLMPSGETLMTIGGLVDAIRWLDQQWFRPATQISVYWDRRFFDKLSPQRLVARKWHVDAAAEQKFLEGRRYNWRPRTHTEFTCPSDMQAAAAELTARKIFQAPDNTIVLFNHAKSWHRSAIPSQAGWNSLLAVLIY